MKFIKIMMVAALFATMAISCGKDDDDEIVQLDEFSGTLKFDVDKYLIPGQKVTLTPYGAENPNGDYGLYWSIPMKKLAIRDTVKVEGEGAGIDCSISFTVPTDTLCNFTITCNMFAKGFSTASASMTVSIVDSEKSLTFDNDFPETTFTDSRDGKVLPYGTYNGVDWTLRNLACEQAGYPYSGAKPMTDVFGLFYTWEEAQTACPEGWTLPSVEDWKALCALEGSAEAPLENVAGALMANVQFNAEAMWTSLPTNVITNKSGLSLIPAGFATVTETGKYKFGGQNTYAAFWTSSERDSEQGEYVYVREECPDAMIGSGHKTSFAASVRCIRK